MITDCVFSPATLTRRESSREEGEGKHTKVYSTYQQSGNSTGSGIRRLAIHIDECELTGNLAEESVLSLAVNLDRFCTCIQIRDLILQDGEAAAGDLGFTNFLTPYSP